MNDTGHNDSQEPHSLAASLTESQQTQLKESASQAASNIFDHLVTQSIEKDQGATPTSPLGISHPQIFRKGTLIEIPDAPPKGSRSRRSRKGQLSTPKQRLVAICIKDDAQAEQVIEWALQNELVPKRDNVVLIHVRQAANGIIGDLISTNNAKEIAERDRSHGLLRRNAIPVKQEGFNIKGVSIRGVDVRGELVRKLIELKCDLFIIGNHASKSMRERLMGCKVGYLTENAPCPVLVVGGCAQRPIQESSQTTATTTADAPPSPAPASLPC
ncbi:hypothetical protein LPJ53_005425 [Coemansia erecta]|uniref:UspA domain-containing protein n=1 Tax=Coemansia erecta TaxID=147472 RepID=A0A9W7XSH5_9FUNG|nr:hypothetical protein LPJ53_005425 [Coemansia erecta]